MLNIPILNEFSKLDLVNKLNCTLIARNCFRKISFDAKNQIGVLDYKIEVLPLPRLRQTKTFYPNDPDVHSQSFAGFEIHLTRKQNKYFQNFFIPSGLMVVMSWVRCIFDLYKTRKIPIEKYIYTYVWRRGCLWKK